MERAGEDGRVDERKERQSRGSKSLIQACQVHHIKGTTIQYCNLHEKEFISVGRAF